MGDDAHGHPLWRVRLDVQALAIEVDTNVEQAFSKTRQEAIALHPQRQAWRKEYVLIRKRNRQEGGIDGGEGWREGI